MQLPGNIRLNNRMESRDPIIDDDQGKRHSLAEPVSQGDIGGPSGRKGRRYRRHQGAHGRDRVCGKKVGVVDQVGGGAIKLTKKDSPDGQHHFLPVGWVERVDSHVHLKKSSMETEQNWKSAVAACVCSG